MNDEDQNRNNEIDSVRGALAERAANIRAGMPEMAMLDAETIRSGSLKKAIPLKKQPYSILPGSRTYVERS